MSFASICIHNVRDDLPGACNSCTKASPFGSSNGNNIGSNSISNSNATMISPLPWRSSANGSPQYLNKANGLFNSSFSGSMSGLINNSNNNNNTSNINANGRGFNVPMVSSIKTQSIFRQPPSPPHLPNNNNNNNGLQSLADEIRPTMASASSPAAAANRATVAPSSNKKAIAICTVQNWRLDVSSGTGAFAAAGSPYSVAKMLKSSVELVDSNPMTASSNYTSNIHNRKWTTIPATSAQQPQQQQQTSAASPKALLGNFRVKGRSISQSISNSPPMAARKNQTARALLFTRSRSPTDKRCATTNNNNDTTNNNNSSSSYSDNNNEGLLVNGTVVSSIDEALAQFELSAKSPSSPQQAADLVRPHTCSSPSLSGVAGTSLLSPRSKQLAVKNGKTAETATSPKSPQKRWTERLESLTQLRGDDVSTVPIPMPTEALILKACTSMAGRRDDGYCGEFILCSGSSHVRRVLTDLGYEEKTSGKSSRWDIMWSINHHDIFDQNVIKPNQLVNHYEMSPRELGSKVGLLRNLKSLQWFDSVNPDTFHPRTYNMANPWELQDWIDNFVFVEAQAMLVRFDKGENIEPAVLQHSLNIVDQYINRHPYNGAELTLRDYYILRPDKWVLHRQPGRAPLPPIVTFSLQEPQEVKEMVKTVLANVKAANVQMDFDGIKNVWIVKPGCSSRGRGIQLFDDVAEILRFCSSKKHPPIVQKYLESPLLVSGTKKFDVRLWVLVTEWNPLTVWTFEPYFRLCTADHTLSDLKNCYAHLCNRCVQKNSGEYEDTGGEFSHMWDLETLTNHLHQKYNSPVWSDLIWPRMRDVVIQTMHSVQDAIPSRPNTFEWFGFDFMVDDSFGCWLCEVNISPDTACVTDVLSNLVPAAFTDLFNLLLPSSVNDASGQAPLRELDAGGMPQKPEKWRLLYRGKTMKAELMRQRQSAKKAKIAQLRANRPYGNRDAIIAKVGSDLYPAIMNPASLFTS